MNKQLSTRLKRIDLPKIIERDGGFICFYCSIFLQNVKWVFEHLNDNPTDNKIENIVLSCQSCNNKKPHSPEMKEKALEKITQNKKNNFMRVRAREIAPPSFKPEMDINQTNFQITEKYLSEVIAADGEIGFKDALDSCVMVCRKQTDTGSQPAVRRYLDSLISREGDFKVIQNEAKEKVIVRRQDY